ncbi:MAG TPA: NfeD family protein [Allosphingosinicella sp.]|nr:NfeD family protein [Allosphingosinicella sp.]
MTYLEGLGLAPYWWWLIAAVALGILELLAPGFFLVWMGAAAAVTGIVVALVPMPLAWQLGLFVLLAFAAVFAGRLYYARNPVPTSDPNLNARASRLIGQTVAVETAFENGKGRVRVGDGVWNARGPDAPAGASVVIVAADGTSLTVEAAP